MKQVIYIFIAWLGLSIATPALAQTKPAPATGTAPAAPAPRYQVGKLSTDPAQYITDVQSMMASTNNAGARVIAARLKELWASNSLTSSQQTRIVALSQTMLAKKFKPRPHFEMLFGNIVNGKILAKLSDQQMDQFLDVLTQTLDKEAPQETERFLVSTNRFFNGGYLYRSGYNTLRAVGGTISFAYSPVAAPESNLEFGAPTPAPREEPLPAAKPAAKKPAAAKPVAKADPKKKSSSGWDTADVWSSPSGGGWGDADDGWGAPVKKKAPAKKPATKATPATAATKPASAPATPAASDFDAPAPSFMPSAMYDAYAPPPVRGAVIVVKDADLFMTTGGDSVFVRKVSGTAVPGTNRFVATGGQFVWSIKSNLVTAELAGFDFDMTKPEFTAQPVTLSYPAMLAAPVKGALSYKSMRRKPGVSDTGYPRFISLTNDARINTLGDNIQYRGGLSMAGGKVLSAALDGSPSNLMVSLDGKPKFKATSRAYVLGDSMITASRAGVTIYEGAKDSLTHPGAQLKYSKNRQQLKLSREEGLYKNTPYNDSYHQMDIRTEALTWNLSQPLIDFAVLSSKNQNSADFESKEFFTNNRYQQLKSINRLHPLQMLVGYSQAHDDAKTINVSELAENLSTSVLNMRSDMAGLARDGYVAWNPQTGDVTILPKGAHYVASARDKKDYDHLAIKSLSGSGRNATLNLNTNELLVRGVDRFNFSDDSATVYVRPDSAIIRIGKNRSINFRGAVVASAMRFKGRDFTFDYDGFYIDMAKIDSIVIRSETRTAKGKTTGKHADFALTNKGNVSTGRLLLNDPKNKSGRKKKGQYPAFESKSGANMYFGKQDVLGGVYDSTLVFDIPPFRLDSINGIGKSATGFEGTFRSGGILPELKTKLTVQEDGSLGFVYDVPKDGFPLYKGKGRVFNKVKMNGRGLQADGSITYQSGTFTSDAFVFYRDSVVTVGRTGVIAARTEGAIDIPRISMPPNYLMHWNVPQDSMFLATPPGGGTARLYANADRKAKTVASYNFSGTALLTPKGTGGDGRLDGPQSLIKSRNFTFNTDHYSGKHATLSVKSAESNKAALTANDVAFEYNLKKGTADFVREENSKATVELPYSTFGTTLSNGHWDFKKKQVRLRMAQGADSTKAFFYSTNPVQLGLKFKATSGLYDLAKYQMRASGVPRIAAADAWIIPDSGRVNVGVKGKIQRLKNAVVLLDSLARLHRLTKGSIEVVSRAAFTGSADYVIKTANDSVSLRFNNFEPDPAFLLASTDGPAASRRATAANEAFGGAAQGPATVATAAVNVSNKVQLLHRIGYRGSVQLNSRRRGFAFTGEAQLQFGQDYTNSSWVALKDSIDPKNVRINLRDLKAPDNTPLVIGLFRAEQSGKLYPLYGALAPPPEDLTMLKLDGDLRYDAKKAIYTISRSDPSDVNAYEGAALSYSDSTNRITFRGLLSFITPSKDYKMIASGVGTANPDSARYAVDALLGIDFTMPPKAVDVLGTELAKITKNGPEAQTGSTNELYKLAQFIGDKATQNHAARSGGASIAQLSPKLTGHTLLLSQVNLRWNEKRHAWYSVGPIGMAGAGKQSLNALVTGNIEIRREDGAEVVEMYLEAEPQSWYYFKYAKNLMLTTSSSDNFNYEISSKAKYDYETATNYGVFLGAMTDVDAFRTHFQKDYLGKTGKQITRTVAPAGLAEPAEDTGGKKKKKGKADDSFGTDPATDPATADAAPAPSTKKKKKLKANDPFGDGVLDDPAPAPAVVKDKGKAKDKAAAAPATPGTPPPDAATTPAAPVPADAPDPAADKKEAARQAKEAERLKKEEEKAKKEEEKMKKEEEKQKKKKGDDPFGDG